MSESKSLLARLLAKENISVQHGNYTTAYFDVQNRVLGLPLWKDDSKDLHDMLVGHEVGHALFTPPEGWKDAQSNENEDRVPGDYLNVVEDIRIERMIQLMYPGIVRCFKKGYSYLNESDFFGIGDRDVNQMSLMDRINLKAKLRDLIDIDFSDVESPLVKKAFAADTWDEVVEISRELYEFVKNNPESQSQETPKTTNSNNNTQSDDNDDEEGQIDPSPRGSKEEEEEGQIDPSPRGSKEEEDTEDDKNDQEDSKSDSDSDDSDPSESTEQESREDGNKEQQEDEERDSRSDRVETQANARENADTLIEQNDQGQKPLVVNGLSRDQINSIIVPFYKVRDSREYRRKEFISSFQSRFNSDSELANKLPKSLDNESQYKEFLSETKRVVGVMVKEFELRKAAYQYSRSSTARSGSLNLERLHEYKINDDIFRRVTSLADAKSHGMVMLIDNSASMSNARGPIITQVLNLAMFCKRTNIPFDVYSFTNSKENLREDNCSDIRSHHLLLTHVLSSSFNRKDYDVAYRQLYNLANNISASEGMYDEMSGTPLNDILTGMHIILKDFKRKYQVQKPIFTLLTDGDSSLLTIKKEILDRHAECNGGFSPRTRTGVRILLAESKQILKPTSKGYTQNTDMTTTLLNGIRKEVPGLINIGYFVANDSSDFSRSVTRATGRGYSYSEIREARKIANRDKFVSFDKVLGFDRYFILKATQANSLQATDDDFEISKQAKRGEITRAFKKYAKSKKGNRVLATQFAEIVS